MENDNPREAQRELAQVADELVRWQPTLGGSVSTRTNTQLAMATNDLASKMLADAMDSHDAQHALQRQTAAPQ